ncbi:MAG: chalcone isomerase family protein [Flavobacteriales bacterium]|nr:chalcone isomerase family protein [Flavobacteriales bacterium]NQX97915.1 chalcone isomerase family protein [Flavobacteriales bacterium]
MKKILILLIILSQLSIVNAQITISDVTMPKNVTLEGTKLSLNGAGLREKLWIDLYVAGLYVKTKTSDANTIINANEPASIKLEIVSSLISSKKMIDAVNEGFKKATNKNTASIKSYIEDFITAFKEEIKVGDVYDINYSPKKGVSVLKNNKLVKAVGGNLTFKKALFGIWLGKDPADDDLKDGMLGE